MARVAHHGRALVRGILVREDPEALIIKPSDGEVSRFGAGTAVHLSKDTDVTEDTLFENTDHIFGLHGQRLYDSRGRVVMHVQSWEVHHVFSHGGAGSIRKIRLEGYADDN